MYYDQFNMIYNNGWLYEEYPDSYGSWANGVLDSFSKMKDEARKENPYWASVGSFATMCMDSVWFCTWSPASLTTWNSSVIQSGPTSARCSWNGGFGMVAAGARTLHLADRRPFPGNGRQNPERSGPQMGHFHPQTPPCCKVPDLRRTFKDTAALALNDASGKAIALAKRIQSKTGALWWLGGRVAPFPDQGVSARWFLFKQMNSRARSLTASTQSPLATRQI